MPYKLSDVYPVIIQKFTPFVPLNDGWDEIQKLNAIISHLNEVGQISQNVANNWNKVIKWVVEEGLTETVSAKIDKLIADGLFDDLLSESLTTLNGVVDQFKNDVNGQVSGLNAQITNISKVIVILDQFPRNTNETDDTGRLQRATDYLVSLGGGILRLPTGEFIATSYKLKDKVIIQGSGVGTVLKLADGINQHFITLNNDQVRHAGLMNLTVDGNKWNNTIGGSHGIYLNAVNPVIDENGYYVDNFLVFDSIYIRNCSGNAFVTDNNIREAHLNKVIAFRNNWDGFSIKGSDCYIRNCTAYWNGGNGFGIFAPNHKISNCKGWGNTTRGFYFNGAKRIIGSNLEAQENGTHGFDITNCKGITLLGIIADANGFSDTTLTPQPSNFNGVNISASDKIRVDGYATNFHIVEGMNVKSAQCYGVRVDGTTDYDVSLRMDSQYQEYLINNDSTGVLRVNGRSKVIWKTPTLPAGFTHNGGDPLQYGIDGDNIVHIQGATTLNTSGNYTAQTIFQLPANMRPSHLLQFVTPEGFFQVKRDGNIVVQNASNTGYFSYTCSFRAE